eukprot:CAMPEP_0174310088 /NCGR_PEP_ID=MMETSP0810-20121108/2827_1 /TAXON_ID=73025 ORGANISM="Eutreptiella gymnastica-like, Strain CCMP1594" /NCGR_SAMPLE_ID=MMETSP0810 /ASSEMBLY_ACC=CAM_ASM_000659 /LENGTH=667 /DNA_ID=CAMNT_0015417905 /DNA_START=40 /DNA_END=2040 /DNA_ORIENTATION=-
MAARTSKWWLGSLTLLLVLLLSISWRHPGPTTMAGYAQSTTSKPARSHGLSAQGLPRSARRSPWQAPALDGRPAVPHPQDGEPVPPELTAPWRIPAAAPRFVEPAVSAGLMGWCALACACAGLSAFLVSQSRHGPRSEGVWTAPTAGGGWHQGLQGYGFRDPLLCPATSRMRTALAAARHQDDAMDDLMALVAQEEGDESWEEADESAVFESTVFANGDADASDDELDAGPPQEQRRKPPPVRLVTERNHCPACGAKYQNKTPDNPGYLPPKVFERVWEADWDDGWTVGDEVAMIIQDAQADLGILPENTAEEEEEDEAELAPEDEALLQDGKQTVCQRCHSMQHKRGKLQDTLRSGWGEDELLQPERFRALLEPLRKKACTIVMFVDLFDFHGSILKDLRHVAGFNRVLIVANKADLLPERADLGRVQRWVWQECKRLRLPQITMRDIYLVSCKTGLGIETLLTQIKRQTGWRETYIVGAANVGKSSFINALMHVGAPKQGRQRRKGKKAPPKRQLVTASFIPGTTLDFVKVDVRGTLMYDTPGILMPHQLTSRLTSEEIAAVVPSKRIRPVTLRIAPQHGVLIGAGLAQVDVVAGKAMQLTFFMAPDVTLHPCKTEGAAEKAVKHAGGLLKPPFEPERVEMLLEGSETFAFDIEGHGRERASKDL